MNEDMKKCPFCGKEIKKDATMCKYCMKRLDENDSNGISSILVITLSVVAVLLVVGVVYGLCKILESTTLPKCDSQFAEQQVLDIFKQHNPIYQDYVKYGLLGDIKFSNPAPESYDKDIKRYECTADVTMYPNTSLGLPNFVYIDENIPYGYVFYKLAKCRVSYSIFKANGKNEVRTTTCSTRYDDLEFINKIMYGKIPLTDSDAVIQDY